MRSQIAAENESAHHVYIANWVAINGTEYKNCGLLLRAEDDAPVFKLFAVYLCDHKVYFHVNALDTLQYNAHFHCFIVKLCQRESIIRHSDLLLYVPHHIRSFPGHPGKHCIVPCYHFVLS